MRIKLCCFYAELGDTTTTASAVSLCFCERGESHIDVTPREQDSRKRPVPGSTPHLSCNIGTSTKKMRLLRHEELEEFDASVSQQRSKLRTARKVRGVYSSSCWFKYVDVSEEDPLNDPLSWEAKVFKARFRVPWSLFYGVLLPWSKEHFPSKADAVKRPPMPMELKLLGVLRMLGRGLHVDDTAEFADAGFKGEVLRVFFHKWTAKFTELNFKLWIRPPETEEEISTAVKPYADAGVPGAIASVDGVHVRWDRCSQSNLIRHKGKEAYPSLGFQVSVLHTTWIISCTQAFAGSYNDKTITRYDEFVQKIHNREMYSDREFVTFDATGHPTRHRGLWLICDNGYHRWRVLQHPSKVPESEADTDWSSMLESLRKDVECTFGRLKGRFRILKYGLRFHSKIGCENAMHTCCILHNMILREMGLDTWEDIEYEEDDERDRAALERIIGGDIDYARIVSTAHTAAQDLLMTAEEDEPPTADYIELRRALIEHFAYKWARHEVHWSVRYRKE